MCWAKILLVAMCCQAPQTPMADPVNEETDNCSALPEKDSMGQRLLLQHSEVHRSTASFHTDARQVAEVWAAMGLGICVDAAGKTEASHTVGGWAPCVCNKPFASVCAAGSCPDIKTCQAECDTIPECRAVGWTPRHCWLYGPIDQPYVKGDGASWWSCYIKGTWIFNLVAGPGGQYCSTTGMISQAGSAGRSYCEERCAADDNCKYYSLWSSGGVGWCRLSSSCENFEDKQSGEMVNIYQKASFVPKVF